MDTTAFFCAARVAWGAREGKAVCHPLVNSPECLSKSKSLFGRACRALRAPEGSKSNVCPLYLCPFALLILPNLSYFMLRTLKQAGVELSGFSCISEKLQPDASTSSLQLSQRSSGSPLILFLVLTHQIFLLFLSLSHSSQPPPPLWRIGVGILRASRFGMRRLGRRWGGALAHLRTERLGVPQSMENL